MMAASTTFLPKTRSSTETKFKDQVLLPVT
jgi:hypothetical protein